MFFLWDCSIFLSQFYFPWLHYSIIQPTNINDLIIDREWTMVDLPIYAYPGVGYFGFSPESGISSSQLRQEFEGQNTLFQAQTLLVQHLLEAQAHTIADALRQSLFPGYGFTCLIPLFPKTLIMLRLH